MKKFYLLLFIFAISQIAIIAKGPVDGTIVSTFYLTFPPAYQESDADSLKASVLISSFNDHETNVAITINSRNYRKEITLAPFTSEEIFFDIDEAFPVQRKVTDTIAYENIFPSSGIKIEADGNINCYGLVKSNKICEGFLVYPLDALNKYYIVSTQTSHDHKAPAYSAIVGVYDNTKVTFRIGGCINCKTIGYDGTHLISGKVIRRTINEGDVWLVPGIGDYNDLSGSVVIASKPVAVISGNYHVNNNENTKKYNYLIEQDIPSSLYGRSFHTVATKNHDSVQYFKIFAKSVNTPVSINKFPPTINIKYPGGMINDGFYYLNKDNEIWDNSIFVNTDSLFGINLTMYSNDNEDGLYPLKMQMVPDEHHTKSIEFAVPNLTSFENYLSIHYRHSGPDDNYIKLIEHDKGKLIRKNLEDLPQVEQTYNFPTLNDKLVYRGVVIKIEPGKMYSLEGTDVLSAYIFGNNANSAYGFPLQFDPTIKTGLDKAPPQITKFDDTVCGNLISGSVVDNAVAGNDSEANLINIYIDKDSSSNFIFSYDNFIIGTSNPVKWYLNVIDPTKDALAKLICIDRSGNTTEKVFEFKPHNISIIDTAINFGKFVKVDSTNENIRLFTIKNKSSFNYISDKYKIIPVLYSQINNQTSNFELLVQNDITPLNVNQEKSFEIRFTPNGYGHFIDSVGFVLIDNSSQDTCIIKYDTELRADVYQVFMQADGVDFGEQIINSEVIGKTLTLTNPNQSPFISELPIQIVGYETIGDSIGDANSDKIFKILDIDKITEKNPIKIDVGGKYELNVQFRPDSAKEYTSYIKFKVKTDISPIFIDSPFQEAIIKGIGKVGTSVNEDISSELIISPNPAGEYILINFQRCATLQKCGTSEIGIYDVMGVLIHTTPSASQPPLHEGNLRIDVSNLAPGVYFVKIGGIVKKFVKM